MALSTSPYQGGGRALYPAGGITNHISRPSWLHQLYNTSRASEFNTHDTRLITALQDPYEHSGCTGLLSLSECSWWWWWWWWCWCYSPSVNIEWSRRDGSVLSMSSSVVDYGRRLLLSAVTPSLSGQYVCHASNKIGDATATVLLTVDGMCSMQNNNYRPTTTTTTTTTTT